MAQDLQQPQDHSVAAYDDLSWSIPKFGRYEEFEPGPFQKGFTPTAYEQTGWETRDSDWANELPMWWADDSTLVDTVQWFDQVFLQVAHTLTVSIAATVSQSCVSP
jgi:hypothetical protein